MKDIILGILFVIIGIALVFYIGGLITQLYYHVNTFYKLGDIVSIYIETLVVISLSLFLLWAYLVDTFKPDK